MKLYWRKSTGDGVNDAAAADHAASAKNNAVEKNISVLSRRRCTQRFRFSE